MASIAVICRADPLGKRIARRLIKTGHAATTGSLSADSETPTIP